MPLFYLHLNFFLLDVLESDEIIGFLALIILIIVIIAAASRSRNKSSGETPFVSAYGPTSPPPTQTVVVVNQGKSVGVAFLLTFFFGPLGLLYASVAGGIIMIILSIVIGIVTLGAGLVFTWIVSIIWGVAAASSAGQQSTTVVTNNSPVHQPPPVTEQKPAASSATKESLLNQLSQLHQLREKGVLTEEIYERERQHILDKLSGTVG